MYAKNNTLPIPKIILWIDWELINITITCPSKATANEKQPYFEISTFQLKDFFTKIIIKLAIIPTPSPIGSPKGESDVNSNPAKAKHKAVPRSSAWYSGANKSFFVGKIETMAENIWKDIPSSIKRVVPCIFDAKLAQVTANVNMDKIATPFNVTYTKSLSLCTLKAETPQRVKQAPSTQKKAIKLII